MAVPICVWLATPALAVAMQHRTHELRTAEPAARRRAPAGDPGSAADYTAQNQQSLSDIRSQLGSFKIMAQQLRDGIKTDWDSRYGSAISRINSQLNGIQGQQSTALANFAGVKNVNNMLRGIDLPVNMAAKVAMKHSKRAEEDFQKIESDFDKQANKNEETFNKWENDQVAGYLTEMRKSQDAMHKSMEGYVKASSGVNSDIATGLIKFETKLDATGSKYEEKFEGEMGDLEKEIDIADDSMSDSETYIENAEEDTDSVVTNMDPKSPGVDLILEEAAETIEDAEEESADVLTEMSADMADNMKYTEEDVQYLMNEAAAAAAEAHEDYAKTIMKTGDAIQDSLTTAKGANVDAQLALRVSVGEELAKTEVLSEQLERLAEKVDKSKDGMYNRVEAMTERNAAELEKIYEENLDASEDKAGNMFGFIETSAEKEEREMASDVGNVVQTVLTDVQTTADKSSGLVTAEEQKLGSKANILGEAMDRMTKVEQEMADQSRSVQLIPQKRNEVEVEYGRVASAKDAALAEITSQSKKMLATGTETQFSAEKAMASAYAQVAQQVSDAAKKLAENTEVTAGAAAEELNTMVQTNLQKSADLKGDVATADLSLSTAAEVLRKAQITLEAVPETFSTVGSETSNAYKDVSFAAKAWARDGVEPTENSIKRAASKNGGELSKMETAVEATMQRSKSRISAQTNGIDTMIAGAQQESAAQRTARENGKILIQSELASHGKEMEASEKRHRTDIDGNKEKFAQDSLSFKNQIAAQKSQFEQITANATSTGQVVVAAFNEQAGAAMQHFMGAILNTSQSTDMAVLAAKQAVNEATRDDTVEFKHAVGRALTDIQGVMNEQAKLYSDLNNKAAGDALNVADESFIVANQNQERLNAMIEDMSKRAEGIAQKATMKIHDAASQHTSDRTNLQVALQSSLNDLAAMQNEAHSAFASKMESVHHESLIKAKAMDEAMQAVNAGISAEDRQMQEEAGIASVAITTAEGKVDAQFRANMVKAEEHTLAASSRSEQESMQAAGVAAATERESALIDKDVERAEQAAHDHINSMKPDVQAAQLGAEVNGLSGLFNDEIRKTQSVEDEAEQQALKLSESAESALSKGLASLASLGPLIDKETDKQEDYFQQVADMQNSSHLDIRNALDQLIQLGTDMKVAMAQKALDMQRHMRSVEDEVKNLNSMLDYSNGDELTRISSALLEGVNQTSDLVGMVDGEVTPKTRDLRKRVGQVYEDMGYAMDLDAVDDMGNSTMESEQSLRSKLTGARETLERVLNEEAHKTQGALNAVYEETKALIDQVESMSHLSVEEKKAKVRVIKATAARKTAQVMAQARATVQRQMKEAHGIDKKEQEIGVLLSRATMLASGQFQTTDAAFIKKQLAEAAAGIEDKRKKYINPFSLIQEDDQKERPWSPTGELRGDLLEAENLDLHRDQDDKQLEAQLAQMRAVAF